MLSGILKSLVSAVILLGLSEWQGMKIQGMRMLRRKMGGTLLVFLAIQLVSLAIGFFAAAFFLGMAEVDGFVRPAFITGTVLLAIAVVTGLEGVRLMRRG